MPFVFSGFWSKEAILHAASEWGRLAPAALRGPRRRRPHRLLHDAPPVRGLLGRAALPGGRPRPREPGRDDGPARRPRGRRRRPRASSARPPGPGCSRGSPGAESPPTRCSRAAPSWRSRSSSSPSASAPAGRSTGGAPRATAAAADPLAAAAPRLFAFLGARMKLDELYAATLGRLNDLRRGARGRPRPLGLGGRGRAPRAPRRVRRAPSTARWTRPASTPASTRSASGSVGAGQAYSRAQTGEAHGYLRDPGASPSWCSRCWSFSGAADELDPPALARHLRPVGRGAAARPASRGWAPGPAARSRWPSASPRSPSAPGALASFDRASTGYQFVERHAWIGALNVHYHLGLDGLSLLLVLLTGLLAPASLLASWRQRARPAALRPALPAPPGRRPRRLPRPRLLPLVRLLGAEPHPRVFPDQAVGRPQARRARPTSS